MTDGVIRAASYVKGLSMYERRNKLDKLACIHSTSGTVTGHGQIANAVEKDDRVAVRPEQARRE